MVANTIHAERASPSRRTTTGHDENVHGSMPGVSNTPPRIDPFSRVSCYKRSPASEKRGESRRGPSGTTSRGPRQCFLQDDGHRRRRYTHRQAPYYTVRPASQTPSDAPFAFPEEGRPSDTRCSGRDTRSLPINRPGLLVQNNNTFRIWVLLGEPYSETRKPSPSTR